MANPAPVSLEVEDLILILFPCLLGIFCLSVNSRLTLYRTEYHLLFAIILYISYLLISVVMGFLQGVAMLTILRSIGPYLNFTPLLLLCFLPHQFLKPWSIAFVLILVGSLQAAYQLYLYLTPANSMMDTVSILRNRITLVDPRATLPLVLALAILPLSLLSYDKGLFKQSAVIKMLIIGSLIFLGLLGGMVTLTRAIVLSILLGWVVFLMLYAFYQTHLHKISAAHLLRQNFIYILLFLFTMIVISTIPKVHMLEQGILARFYHSSSFSGSADYSNGRIYDEWLPALNVWINSNLVNLFFGIGAGNTFTVANGEERTYIHNLCLYSLVYGGFFGFFTCLWLYFTAFKTLITRALQTHQTIYLGFAALLGSIFFYGQLFAVHKGLAFNVLLFLMLAVALCKPFNRQITND